jgi:hypothetical protein
VKACRFATLILSFVILSLATRLAAADQSPTSDASNLISNGGFEDGMHGWQWEQWRNKPLPGVLDKADHHSGAASFKMGLPGADGGRYLAKEIAIPRPDQGYLLSLWLKAADLPDGAVHARVAIPDHGWLGAATGRFEVIKTAGTHDWKRFEVPLPAKALDGVKKITIFIYDDKIGQGTLGIDDLSMTEAPLTDAAGIPTSAKLVLTADTSRPDASIFPAGEPVKLTFNVKTAADATMPTELKLTFTDEHDQPIDAKTIPIQPDANGRWQTTVEAPSQKLGFYRVHATLSDGTELSPMGSRPAGIMTYAAVPDPAKRPRLDENNSRFGMQGAPYVGEVPSLLGIRWVLDDGLFWRRTEPDHAGQFSGDRLKKYISGRNPGTDAFPVYTLVTLFVAPKWAVEPETFSYETGKLTPEGEKAWADYCKAAATAYCTRYPTRHKHIYQITWEPIRPWGFKGTDQDLIRIYQIAYPILHKADPQAIVAGPCRGLWNNGDPQATVRLFKLGLGKYLDAYIAHPYYSKTPEMDGMPQSIRNLKQMLRDTTGKDLPLYGSEQGLTSNEEVSKELTQAQILIRQDLITLGEGFQFNLTFTFYDYRLAGQKGYGCNYNLEKNIPFGSHNKVSPKPISPAYAAASMLLDGSDSVGAIEWLGPETWGYAFQNKQGVTLALWSYGSKPQTVTVPTGSESVQVYDWMGNADTVPSPTGSIQLALGPEPTYITGVSPKLWGAQAANLLVLDHQQVQGYTGQQVVISGKSLMPADKPFQGTIALESDTPALAAMSQPLTLGGDQPASFQFQLTLPSTLQPGKHTLRLRLCDAQGHAITGKAVALEILSPLDTRIATTFTDNGKPALAITLQDQRGRATSGRLDVSVKELLPGARRSNLPMIDLVADPGKSVDVPHTTQQVHFNVPAKGTQRLLVSFPDASFRPARRYEVLATFSIEDTAPFSHTEPVHFLAATHLGESPKIDADLGEWADIPAIQLSAPHDVVRSPKACPPGFSAKLRYAWDEHNLYLAAEVNDDRFIQNNTGMNVWRQDCLQLAFNLDPNISGEAPNAANRRISEINVALTKEGPQAWRSLSFGGDKLLVGDLSPKQFPLAVTRVGDGKLLYEMAIPWTTLGADAEQAFKAGDAIGVAATVNEVRDAHQGDPSALGLFGGITPDKNPDKYGLLTLK